jgi:hypothetical protein
MSDPSSLTPRRDESRIDAISDDGSMPNYESWKRLYDLARTLETELEQERDIRSTREITLSLVADGLGVEHEPHQTFDERLLEASVVRSESMRWIPVSEQQPEGHAEVLVSTNGKYVSTRGASWVRALWREAVTEKIECAVTHWMPMPEGPK